jgi:hypothetical protein
VLLGENAIVTRFFDSPLESMQEFTMKSFKDYYLGTLFRPRPTFDDLLNDDRRLKFGLLAMLVNAILYTFVYIFLRSGRGAPSSFTPWLAVPKDVYYFYNQFWLAPSMFGCWILAAGVAHLLSKLSSGKGSFEDTLSVFGFGITIATLFPLLHDFTDSFLVAVGVLDARWYEIQLNSPTLWRLILWTLYSTGLILLPVLLTKGVASAQRIKGAAVVLIGILAAIIYQGGFVIFNR